MESRVVFGLLLLVAAAAVAQGSTELTLPPVEEELQYEVGGGNDLVDLGFEYGDLLYERSSSQDVEYKATRIMSDDDVTNRIADQEAAIAIQNSKSAKKVRKLRRKDRVGLVAEGLEARRRLIKEAYEETKPTPVPAPSALEKLKAVRHGQFPRTAKHKDARVNVEPANRALIYHRDNTRSDPWKPPKKGSKKPVEVKDALYTADVSKTNPYNNPYMAPAGPNEGPNRAMGAYIDPEAANATPIPVAKKKSDVDPDSLGEGLPRPRVPRTGGRLGIQRATGRKIRPGVNAPDYKPRRRVFGRN